MQNILQLSTPQSSHENLDNIDQDLLNFFKTESSGHYNGSVLSVQIKRNLIEPFYRRISFGYMVLLFLVLFLFSIQTNAKAQVFVESDTYTMSIEGTNKSLKNIAAIPVSIINNSRAVSGKIYTINGQPITGAEVKQIKGKSSYVTKQNGSFVFLVEENIKQIQITAPGFVTKLVSLTNEEHYEITLEPLKVICPTRAQIMEKIELLKTID